MDAEQLTELRLNFCLHSFLSDPSAKKIFVTNPSNLVIRLTTCSFDLERGQIVGSS